MHEKKVQGFSIFKPEDVSLKIIEGEILKAKADTGVFVLIGHMPVQVATGRDTFTYKMLDSICKFVVSHNMKFYRMQDL